LGRRDFSSGAGLVLLVLRFFAAAMIVRLQRAIPERHVRARVPLADIVQAKPR